MNIRQHALQSIRSGMPAQIIARAGVSGVQFLADDAEFIDFDDLNYNPEIGYYRMSIFPDQPRECTNENPETIHVYEDTSPEEPMFVWSDGDGYPHLLGTEAQAADLWQALADFLLNANLHPEPIDEFDPAWGQNYDIADAVREAIAYGYVDDGDEARMADTIRAAARAGRIRKARQVNGAWMLPKLTFRHWLVRSRDEKRGRPRKGD